MTTKSEWLSKKGKPDMYDVGGPTHKGENEAIKDLDKVTTKSTAQKILKTNAYNKFNNKMIKDLGRE